MLKRMFPVLLAGLFLMALGQNQNKPTSYHDLQVSKIAGKMLFNLKQCNECHTLSAQPEGDLTPVQNKRSDDWFAEHVEQESEVVLQETKSARRKKRILRDEVAAVEAYLFNAGAQEKQRIEAMPEHIFRGAYLVYQNNCLNCHKVAGEGKDVAPELAHAAEEHDKDWLIQNLKDPQQFKPESPMPSFDNLPEESLSDIADYILSLKE